MIRIRKRVKDGYYHVGSSGAESANANSADIALRFGKMMIDRRASNENRIKNTRAISLIDTIKQKKGKRTKKKGKETNKNHVENEENEWKEREKQSPSGM